VCANFTIQPEEGDPIEQSFSVGKNWDASRDGSELVREGGGGGSINKNTNFGVFIQSAVDALGGDGSKLGGSPRQAATWIGSKWTFGTIKRTTVNPTTQATSEKDAFVVTEYHGRDGAAPAAGASAKSTAPTASTDDIPTDVWNMLVELANSAADHDAFLEAALDLPEVDGNKAAQKAVMGTKAGSVWAARTA
jgi:hypothetical protein